jgi:hypothetical protein
VLPFSFHNILNVNVIVYVLHGYVEEQRVDFVSLAAGLGCASHALWFNLPKVGLSQVESSAPIA